jgi:hypothetical protein
MGQSLFLSIDYVLALFGNRLVLELNSISMQLAFEPHSFLESILGEI